MASKKYIVSLSSRADRQMIAHTEFLAQVSPTAARRLLADFKKVTKMLANDPFLFPFADDLDVQGIPLDTYRKCLFDKRYKAIYLVEGSEVYVDVVVDCRQGNERLYCRHIHSNKSQDSTNG
ncbi:MAG: type II toxin-antitoxin system RelE/ParE family toxin [Defluviitaleaceae bacterium]|nr:type II toxin-antitoxin system RelE/ParE family toxin [Defluviitaleaceae bacterium]